MTIAAVRGDLSAEALYRAFHDLEEVYRVDPEWGTRDGYMQELMYNPQNVAARLRARAKAVTD